MRRIGASRRWTAAVLALFLAGATGGTRASDRQAGQAAKKNEAAPGAQEQVIETLKQQVELLRKQLEAVQQQIQTLEAQQQEAKRKAQIEHLKQAAAAEAAKAAVATPGQPEAAAPEAGGGTEFVSRTRMQPQLNPEISVTGDMFAIGGNRERERASIGEWEMDVRSYLDPFSQVHLTLSKPEDDGIEVEEGYVTWLNLGKGLSLTAGRKRQQFGVLNRWHSHALDQVDAPWVLEESFGEEGLKGTGLSLDWLMPRLWANTNELTFEVMNGDNDVAFAGTDWEHPSFLARLKSYWDLTSDSYVEIGLNGLHGDADPDGKLDHDFLAVDFTYNWYPAGRELYRDFTVRGMVLRSNLDRQGMSARRAWGGYLYGQFKFTPHWIVGLRFDRVDDQRDDAHHFWGVSPYVTFWQSEFVRLRAQGSYRDDNLFGVDRRILLQLTVAAGPHKHENY